MEYVPDHEDIRRYIVNEQDRLDKYLKRFKKEESEDSDERIISSYKSETRND
ncbi:MAG TPA: hypothetical protein VN258_11480 [Mobilitalea sp.]|nr:hypothetical protein [Mobilitalea sp.]